MRHCAGLHARHYEHVNGDMHMLLAVLVAQHSDIAGV